MFAAAPLAWCRDGAGATARAAPMGGPGDQISQFGTQAACFSFHSRARAAKVV